MKHVYIAHQLSAKTKEGCDENRAAAAKFVAAAALAGVVPVATWIIMTAELPETPESRALGLALDCAQIDRCDEVWLCGPTVSEGMKIELAHARLRGIVVRHMTGMSPTAVGQEARIVA